MFCWHFLLYLLNMVIHVCALLCFVGQSQKTDLTETEVIIIGVICAVILLSLIIVLIVIICRRRTNGRRPIHVDPCSSSWYWLFTAGVYLSHDLLKNRKNAHKCCRLQILWTGSVCFVMRSRVHFLYRYLK